jgi:hypothetical protein
MVRPNPRSSLVTRIFIAQLICLGAIGGYFVFAKDTGKIVDSFLLSLVVGFLGGTISMIKTMRKLGDDSVAAWSESLTGSLLPMLYAGILAGVLYLLFMSGVLSGVAGQGLLMSNLFPDFTMPKPDGRDVLTTDVIFAIRPASVTDFGKLLAWSFIAGYSESFVLGILSALEKKVRPDDAP